MRSKINARTVFLCSTVFFFLLNIIGILLFKDHIGKSVNTLVASVLFVIQLIRGLLACAFKDRIGKELVVVALVSFWFLPIHLLRDLAGEFDSGFSYLAVICLALVTAPLPILLCLYNRLFDRK